LRYDECLPTGLILVPLLKRALVEDATFKKECLYKIAKEFDVNQVSVVSFKTVHHNFCSSKPSTFASKIVAQKTVT
jgi:hypothetical protein